MSDEEVKRLIMDLLRKHMKVADQLEEGTDLMINYFVVSEQEILIKVVVYMTPAAGQNVVPGSIVIPVSTEFTVRARLSSSEKLIPVEVS
mgnify:CR=1 FL=1